MESRTEMFRISTRQEHLLDGVPWVEEERYRQDDDDGRDAYSQYHVPSDRCQT